MTKYLLLCLLVLGCQKPSQVINSGGDGNVNVNVPAWHPSPLPKFGNTEWVSRGKFWVSLICESNGLIMAEVHRSPRHEWRVLGEDGNTYGSYVTEKQAENRAESLVNNGHPFMRCMEDER